MNRQRHRYIETETSKRTEKNRQRAAPDKESNEFQKYGQ